MHRWGFANQVIFDAGKEYFSIFNHTDHAKGSSVKLLGIDFDSKLQMNETISGCIHEASWRLRTILRTRRFYNDLEMVLHFKSHVLSYLEYRTAGIYHATSIALAPLDHVLDRLLQDINMTTTDALLTCNLAPLASRRDIAMLGMIHRAVLRLGPTQFYSWFQLDINLIRISHRLNNNLSRRLVERPDLIRLDIG